jgi:hypothetical protein
LLRKLSSACFLMRSLYYILNAASLKLVNFAHFHSVVIYIIIFWGNHQDVNKMFILQKRILRWMLGLGYRSSCRTWLKQFEILTVPSLFSYSLAMFVICSSSCFQTSFSVHSIHTRQKNHLPNKWLNLHPYKGALLILPFRYSKNYHWTLLSFNMTKCSSRLHWKKYLLTNVF